MLYQVIWRTLKTIEKLLLSKRKFSKRMLMYSSSNRFNWNCMLSYRCQMKFIKLLILKNKTRDWNGHPNKKKWKFLLYQSKKNISKIQILILKSPANPLRFRVSSNLRNLNQNRKTNKKLRQQKWRTPNCLLSMTLLSEKKL